MHFTAMLRALWYQRVGPSLLIIQVALSIVVLANVAYIIGVRIETTGRATGIDLDRIFWIESQGYAAGYNHAATVRGDLQYLNHLPGVIAATTSNAIPQTFSGLRSRIAASPDTDRGEIGIIYQVTERAIDALGAKLVLGRAPRADAVIGPPVADLSADSSQFGPEAVITEAVARRVFGGAARSIGRPLFLNIAHGHPMTVVGVIERLQAAPYFAPGSEFVDNVVLTPSIPAGPGVFYIVRAESGRQRDALMARVARDFELRQPGRYVSRIEALSETASRARSKARGSALILAILSAFVLIIVILGLFGFATFTVARRTREIGIWRALGASRTGVLKYFLLENWTVLTMGISGGVLLTLAIGVQISLFLQLPRLPLDYLLASILTVGLTGTWAVWLPASRAARIPPATATRMA